MTTVSSFIHVVRQPPRNGLPARRFGVLALAIVAVGVVMIYRLVSLQVVHPERYVEHGESQRIRSADLSAERGAIVDRYGVELAVSSPRLSIYADPRLVEDPAATAQQIVAIAGGDLDQLTRRLSNGEKKFAWMSRQLDDETAAAVLALELPGIYSHEEQARITPGGANVARAVVGRTDPDGIGQSGLEKQFNDLLTGENGRVVVERGIGSGGSRGVTIPDGRYELITPVSGESLVLTLDRTVQFEVENLLEQHVARVGAASGTVVVTRPHTGEILAMATAVRSDDGAINLSSENRAVTAIFEPGSISKPIAMGALLNEGLITPSTTVDVTDEVERYDIIFADEVKHENSILTASQVLETSSNVGTTLLVDNLTNAQLHDYLEGFGIGRRTAFSFASDGLVAEPNDTDLSFPFEARGRLDHYDDWSGVSKPFAAIGYGYSATPLQMLRAYNVFANHGVLVEPHIVAGVARDDGNFDILSPRQQTEVVTTETAQTVTSMLAGVVSDGTGQLASVPGYQIAGKTGTARIAQPGGGYEDEDGEVHHYASFAGYLPAASPELSIIVVIEDPEGDPSGGRHAAPLFGEISNFALQHLRIPPAASLADNG